MLVERGVDRISAEELTVPPGMDELFALLQLKRHHEAGDYEVIVVDCAPDRRDAAAAVASRTSPAGGWSASSRSRAASSTPRARSPAPCSTCGCRATPCSRRSSASSRNLIAMNEILRDTEHVSLRLVMNPDRMVIDEARRTFTYLNLYGFLTDAVVVNRVFPAEVGAYFDGLARRASRST